MDTIIQLQQATVEMVDEVLMSAQIKTPLSQRFHQQNPHLPVSQQNFYRLVGKVEIKKYM